MAKKKQSKGNFFNFIDDAASDPKLHKQMVDVINKKGIGETPKTLLEKFHRLGYDGVSLRDSKKILVNLKRIKNPSAWDWSY